MSFAKLAPLERRTFVTQTSIAFFLAVVLAAVFPWPAPGRDWFAPASSAFATRFPLVLSAAVALLILCEIALVLRNLASRLLTLALPATLTATALLLLVNDLAVGFVFKGFRALDGNVPILAGLLGAVAIMRPVENWRTDKATFCFILVVALIGIDQYAMLARAMLQPGADDSFSWVKWASLQTGLPRLFRLPSGALPGLVLVGLACVQRRMARDVPSRRFAPIPLGLPLVGAGAFGIAVSAALYLQFDAATRAGSLFRLLLMIPLNSLLYGAPLFCFLGAAGSKAHRASWLLFCGLSLLLMATWLGQSLQVDQRAAAVERQNANPINWSGVPVRGRPLMVDYASPGIEAKAQQSGFASSFTFRYTQRVYVRGTADDRFDGPDDFIEITLGAHKPGRRFSAESGRPRSPAILHVYDVRDGKRVLLGTRIVERYRPPASPPCLDFDGSWVVDRARIREASEEDMILRILDEIPPGA